MEAKNIWSINNAWNVLNESSFVERTTLSPDFCCLVHCLQTLESFSQTIQHLLEINGLDYILNGKIQLDPLEKGFERYHKLSSANYFG